MFRVLAVAIVLSQFTTSVWAQAQPVAGTAAAPAPGKAAATKLTPKAKKAAKPLAAAEGGPCQLGVIPVVGDQFVVQKVGLTVFNNEQTEVPIDAWGLDDLVVARVRAAMAPGSGIRKIAYPKAAFAPYDHPAPALFRNPANDLTAIVQQVAGNTGCERYVVVTKFDGQLEGTNQTLRGIGVLNRGIGSIISHTTLFANVQVTVFDGQTFAIKKKPVDLGSILAGNLARLTQGEDPLTKLDNAAFPEPATAAASSATLRDGARALLTERLDKALPGFLGE